MKLKFNLFFVFTFLIITYGFSQDPVNTKKTLYKIKPSEVKPIGCGPENKLVQAETKSIHSCEINKSKKEAIISTTQPDGTISKETLELKEVKK